MEASDPPPPIKPALWNPDAAGAWSLLFTPAFGAFLHARNARVLGRLEEEAANWKWFYGTLAYLAVCILLALAPIPEGVFRLAGLAVLLTWYFTTAKKQVTFVKETLGRDYHRKGWRQPLLIGFGCLVGVLVASFLFNFALAFAYVMITGEPLFAD